MDEILHVHDILCSEVPCQLKRTVGFLVGTGGMFVSSVGEGVSSHVHTGDGALDIVGMLDAVGEVDGDSSSSTSSEQGPGVGFSVGKGVISGEEV